MSRALQVDPLPTELSGKKVDSLPTELSGKPMDELGVLVRACALRSGIDRSSSGSFTLVVV